MHRLPFSHLMNYFNETYTIHNYTYYLFWYLPQELPLLLNIGSNQPSFFDKTLLIHHHYQQLLLIHYPTMPILRQHYSNTDQNNDIYKCISRIFELSMSRQIDGLIDFRLASYSKHFSTVAFCELVC